MTGNQSKEHQSNAKFRSKTKNKIASDSRSKSEEKYRTLIEVEKALRESEERYRSLIDSASEGFCMLDLQLKIIEVNKAFCDMLDFSQEEILGKTPFDFVDEENHKIFKEQTDKIASTDHRHYNVVLKSKSGKDVYTRLSATTVKDPSNNVIGSFAFITNITEHKEVEEALSKAKDQMEQVYRVIPSAIFTVDTNSIVTSFNKKAEEITGYSSEEIIGKKCTTFALEPCTRGCGLLKCAMEIDEPIVGKICTIRKKDGEARLASKNMDLIRDIDGNVIGGVESFEDITERKKAEETIKHMAYYDPLTNLPNRALLNDRLSLAIAHANRNNENLAVLFLDLDNFKTINDTLGHNVGDELLQGVAERLIECMREGDTVARLGGDEFVLLLPQVNQAGDVAKVAKKVLEAVKPPFRFGNRDLHITTSIGIAFYPSDGKDSQTLLKNADSALYRAKEYGRDNYQLYASSMNVKAFERLSLENNIRKAIEREEFVLFYQPQVDLASEKIIGMEALLRWQHPDLGLVHPAEFIPIAEETGLIIPIGEWVIRTACEQNKAWQNAGHPTISVSVNLSPYQFQQQNLVKIIKRATKDTGLDPFYLELEITESAIMKDADAVAETLRELKKTGIKISIDDFGTGYSSLGYLKRFPIDNLKVDRSFVRDVITDPDNAAITAAIITLAHALNLKVVAEGAETVEQIEFLRSLQCDAVQGYYFGHPVPAKEATKLLIEQKQLCA